MRALKDFRKLLTTVGVVFVLIGGVGGAIGALYATFATKVYAETLLTQIMANTKRLNIKITDDKIYNLQRTVWAFEEKFKKDCEHCKVLNAQLAQLKRELARQ